MTEEETEVSVVGVGVGVVDVEEVVSSDVEDVVGVVSAVVDVVVGTAVVVGVVVVGGSEVVVCEVRVVGTGSEVGVVTVSAVLEVVSGAREVEVVSAVVLVSVSAGVLVGVADGSDVADAVAEETVAAVSPVLWEVALILLADMINKGLNVNWLDVGLEVGAMLAMLRDEGIHETSWDSALEGRSRRRQGEASAIKATRRRRSTDKTVLNSKHAWAMIQNAWVKREGCTCEAEARVTAHWQG